MANGKLELLALISTDASAIRMYHAFSLLEKLVNAQRKATLDLSFTLLGGFVTLTNVLSIFGFPTTAPWVFAVSIVFMVVIGYYWWESRQKGHELLETVTKFGIYLDEMRRYSRQLEVAIDLSKSDSRMEHIENHIRASLSVALESLDSIIEDIKDIDYLTLGEKKENVEAEIETSKRLLETENTP